MEQNPHACVEGCIIACYGIGAHVAYIYVRDELHLSKARLEGAIEEAQREGLPRQDALRQGLPRRGLRPLRRRRVHLRRRDLDAQLARGHARRAAHQAALPCQRRRLRLPDHGEQPRDHRRRPHGASRWAARSSRKLSRSARTSKDGGVRLFGVNGHVKKPRHRRARRRRRRCNELIYDIGGGVLGDRGVLCVIPGGSSTPDPPRRGDGRTRPTRSRPLHPWHGKSVFDVPLGVDTMRGVGTMLGTCCVTVIAEGTDPVVAHAEPDAVLPPRVVRPVHALPRGQRVARPRRRRRSSTARRRWRSSTACTTSPTASWATPSARSARGRPCRRSASCRSSAPSSRPYVRGERKRGRRDARPWSRWS